MNVEGVIAAYLDARRSLAQEWALRAWRGMFGDRDPASLTALDIARYRKARAGLVKNGTLRRELGAVKAALDWGRRGKLWSGELVDIELPPEGAPRTRTLDSDEEARLWAAAMLYLPHAWNYRRLTRLARFVAIALDTGARKEAIETLRWEQVDLDRGVIDFELPGRAQSKKRRAKTVIPPRLDSVLRSALAQHDGVTPFVLDHSGDVRQTWRSFCDWSGFDINPHDLRRTFVTLSIEAGADIEAVALAVGDNPATLRKHYAHLSPTYLRSELSKRWA